jgi:hypothetical protein|tara:strand:+ start:279 stop:452 length:174 start_codon:yes stop_codon:yes gene_type:complete
MNLQEEISTVKKSLKQAQDDYAHAFAAGDLSTIPVKKRKVAKLTREFGKLIKQRLAK